jgi:hypothetical protein
MSRLNDSLPTLLERLIDQLQVIAPLVQKLEVNARDQYHDAMLALHATERAIATIEELKPKGGA